MTYRDGNLIGNPAAEEFWTPPTVDGEHWVYMHLSASNDVLYVGRTKAPRPRLRGHMSTSDWFAQVVDLVWFGPLSEISAGQVEKELIRAIDPPYNHKHTSRDIHWSAAPDVRRGAIVHRIHRLEEQLDHAHRQLLELDEAEVTA